MTLDDRLTRGLIAGVVAGVSATAWNLFSYYVLHFSRLLFTDFAAIMIYGRKGHGILEKLFGTLVDFIVFGLGGILFAFLIRYVSSKNLVLKGFLWGIGMWFFIYVITLLFKVEELAVIPLRTASSHFIGASIWGITMALVFNYLDKKVKN